MRDPRGGWFCCTFVHFLLIGALCFGCGEPGGAGGDGGPDGGLRPGEDGGGPGYDGGGPASDAAPQPDAEPLVGLPYPERDTYRIKGIQPDFWPDKDELVNHEIGGVAMNLVWAEWEPTQKAPPCGGSEQEYDGHCFSVPAGVDDAIADWTSRGVIVTGIVYGVPEWARTGNTGCSPITAGFDIFCTPDDPADYGRFAGMLASRYDGLHDHGRVADFVIHNEVNANAWFDIGCGQGVPCDADAWIQAYVDNFAAAYDAIRRHQSEAAVLISFEHHYGTTFDRPADANAMLSVQTFLTEFAAKIGDRRWQVAYHPYPPNLLSPEFSPLDLPRVTYGNLGVLLAWLRATFPDDPHAWEVQLTESGINSSSPSSSEAAQAPAVCDTLRNVLGTPGVTNYIYHRLKDHPAEGELQLGLVRADGSFKPAWAVWALANHIDDEPPQLDCGFEHLPYTRLASSVKSGIVDVHWTSSRLPPTDYDELDAWYLLREPEPGTTLLYECLVDNFTGEHTFLTEDLDCGGSQNLGPVGYIWNTQVADTVSLYGCTSSTGWDQFVSTSASCDGQTVDGLLGYALPAP